GLQIQVLNASTSREVEAAFATFVRERPDALFVGNDAFLYSRRVQLVHLATLHKLPATYTAREFADSGGLMSYGINFADALRQLGVYAGRILKGAKPADLPVVQSSKFELVINAWTQGCSASPFRRPCSLPPTRSSSKLDCVFRGASCCTCSRPLLAHRVGSLRRTASVAIGGIADIRRSLAARW